MAQAEQEQSRGRFPVYVAMAFSLVLAYLSNSERWSHLENRYSSVLYTVDAKWIDHLFRSRGMEPADHRITIIEIDQKSIDVVGQYPWRRRVYTRLLDNLFARGVKVVGFDIIFPDRSPSPEDDSAFARGVAKWRDHFVCAISMKDFKDNRYVIQYPFPELKRAAKYLGHIDQLALDGDGNIRSTYLMFGKELDRRSWATDPSQRPSLGLQMTALYEGKPVDEYTRSRNLMYLNIRGQKDIVTHKVEIADSGGIADIVEVEYGIHRIPAWKILNGTLTGAEKSSLKGGIVLLASTALATFDHYPTPFADTVPGVEVHATVIDNLLNHRELHWVPSIVPILLIFVFAFLAAWIVSLNPLFATAIVAGILGAWIVLSHLMFRHLMIMPFAAPAMALLGPFSVLMIRQTMAEQKQKKFIKATFGQFVAPEVVDDLVKDPGRVKLGGEKREMTVFFLDIAHFTAISEKMTPEALILFLNKYLSALSKVIHQRKGVVDKYIGDCIMAFWNAPLEQKDHRAQACLAAVECQEALAELNKNLDSGLPERPAIRIGVNSGDMTVGLTGSEQKLQYTVIGDEVNLASRLEGANKFFGSKIMVSEECYLPAKDAVEARLLGSVRVVGKEKPIRVYELLAGKGRLDERWTRALPLYEKALGLFQGGVDCVKKKESDKSAAAFAEAKAAFNEFLKLVPDDGPARFYANVSEDYSQIPPMDWNGVFNLTSK